MRRQAVDEFEQQLHHKQILNVAAKLFHHDRLFFFEKTRNQTNLFQNLDGKIQKQLCRKLFVDGENDFGKVAVLHGVVLRGVVEKRKEFVEERVVFDHALAHGVGGQRLIGAVRVTSHQLHLGRGFFARQSLVKSNPSDQTIPDNKTTNPRSQKPTNNPI
jgi:hypothetical protein